MTSPQTDPELNGLIEQRAGAATPAATLRDLIMDPCRAKSEHEWWAAREIERLTEALTTTQEQLAKAVEGQGWQDISTAPKDGTVIDVWDAAISARMTVWWMGGQKRGGWRADNQDYDGCSGLWSLPGPHITHWRELPAPPALAIPNDRSGT